MLSGALMSIPLATLANMFGKKTVILSGNVCLVATSLVFFLVPNDVMGTWMVMLPYCIIFGIGRGVWVRTYVPISLKLWYLHVCMRSVCFYVRTYLCVCANIHIYWETKS